MINPKERFQKSPYNKAHADLVKQDGFHSAIEAALSVMSLNLPSTENVSRAWDNACRMQGAKDFVEILLNLSEPTKERPPMASKALRPEKDLSPSDYLTKPKPIN